MSATCPFSWRAHAMIGWKSHPELQTQLKAIMKLASWRELSNPNQFDKSQMFRVRTSNNKANTKTVHSGLVYLAAAYTICNLFPDLFYLEDTEHQTSTFSLFDMTWHVVITYKLSCSPELLYSTANYLKVDM